MWVHWMVNRGGNLCAGLLVIMSVQLPNDSARDPLEPACRQHCRPTAGSVCRRNGVTGWDRSRRHKTRQCCGTGSPAETQLWNQGHCHSPASSHVLLPNSAKKLQSTVHLKHRFREISFFCHTFSVCVCENGQLQSN